MIKIEHLNKYYSKNGPGRLHVLKDVSLEIPDTGMLAIFGRSGCGKTTLLNCIGGLDDFSTGRISADGIADGKMSDSGRCAHVGYVFQNYCLNPERTCYDNVADALRLVGMDEGEKMEASVIAALTAVGMEKYKSRMPDTLSGGQQQRIAIARALVKDPSLILADEPTGNLDEENTVLIMELLADIARDRPVVLVTHEKYLVDDYCHTVVELKDGRVEQVRENAPKTERSYRKRGAIYLADKELKQIDADGLRISYYGEKDSTPPKITLVEHGGRLILRIDGDREVVPLDTLGEVVLHEGSSKDDPAPPPKPPVSIPRVQKRRVGRLFGFLPSVLAGLKIGLGRDRRRRRMLVRTLALFASAVVLVTSIFGTFFKELELIGQSYDHSTFYLRTDSGAISDKLLDTDYAQSGIESVHLLRGFPAGADLYSFSAGFFVSASGSELELDGNATVYSAEGLTEDALLAGELDFDGAGAVISSEFADRLMDGTPLTFINEYEDLIGLSTDYTLYGSIEIRGVVRGDESRIFISPERLAESTLGDGLTEHMTSERLLGTEVEKGSVHLLITYGKGDVESVKVGDTVKIFGKELTVSAVKKQSESYNSWYAGTGRGEILVLADYIDQRIMRDFPELFEQENKDALDLKRKELEVALYGEHLAYFYEELDAYLKDRLLFDRYNLDLYLWDSGIYPEARYASYSHLYAVDVLYEQNGVYPTYTEIMAFLQTSDFFDRLDVYRDLYVDAPYMQNSQYQEIYSGYTFAIDSEDFLEMSKRYGESDDIAKSKEDYSYLTDIDTEVPVWMAFYSVIRSSDPEKTLAWLTEQFPELTADTEGYGASFLSPDSIREGRLKESSAQILAGFATLALILGFMSLCMYFIMRSSLIGRVREIGVYRAIGVSKRNIIFRFAVESAALGSVTVLVGFLLSSLAIYLGFYISPLFEDLMYYPVWLCLCVLLLLAVVTVSLGILPVCMLLRKTPSQILAKYDI